MKKTFQLNVANKKRERVVESIKNEVRKYIKRERSKKLPNEHSFWQFDCKYALEESQAEIIAFNDITAFIDTAAASESDSFYLEIIAVAKTKEKKSVDSSINNDEELS